MYIPEYHRVEDDAVAFAFMEANPFAILISNTDSGLFATHLPILTRMANGRMTLRAHVAKANEHWQILEKGAESLAIFHGPHAYISPTLYESRESVPTWNYITVHAYGVARIISGEADLGEMLEEIISQFDSTYLTQWKSLSGEYRSRMMRHIVGFEIEVLRLQTKLKLSQQRPRVDQENVIRALSHSQDTAASEVARLMRERGLGLK